MKKLIKRLKRVEALIKEARLRQTRTRVSAYYTEFSQEEQREKDVKNYERIEARLLGYKHTILETMQLKIRLEKVDISERQRELTTK